MTAVSLALLLLGTKAIFFYADAGYRDAASGGPISCATGADCVYRRYLADDRAAELAAIGITNVGTFTAFYWREQLQTAGTVILLTTIGGLIGGGLYGLTRSRPGRQAAAAGGAGEGASPA